MYVEAKVREFGISEFTARAVNATGLNSSIEFSHRNLFNVIVLWRQWCNNCIATLKFANFIINDDDNITKQTVTNSNK